MSMAKPSSDYLYWVSTIDADQIEPTKKSSPDSSAGEASITEQSAHTSDSVSDSAGKSGASTAHRAGKKIDHILTVPPGLRKNVHGPSNHENFPAYLEARQNAKLVILQGDSNGTMTRGLTGDQADRVLLGLLPSSQDFFDTAASAIRQSDVLNRQARALTEGQTNNQTEQSNKQHPSRWIHIHENIKDGEEVEFAEECAKKFRRMLRGNLDTLSERFGKVRAGLRNLQAAFEQHRQFTGFPNFDLNLFEVRVHHIQKVKWYAPRVRHIVVDLELRPRW
jgi:hypothetical protein